MALTKVSTGVVDMSGNTGGLVIAKGNGTNEQPTCNPPTTNNLGSIRENTDSGVNKVEVCTSTGWQFLEEVGPTFVPLTFDYLVVAGGGGGGVGGAGAGGYRTSFGTGNINGGLTPVENTLTLSPSTAYAIVVGTGGAGIVGNGTGVQSASGSDSVFSSITSTGGGGAGTAGASGGFNAGVAGGSGGGSHNSFPAGAAVTNPVQGFAGAVQGGCCGGGGGGAGGPGNANTNGGVGLNSSITGTQTSYAGGGGGYPSGGASFGGGASGGNGTGSNATPNTGAGGGSGINGGRGGSGVVILRFPISFATPTVSNINPAGGLTINNATVGTYRVMTYTCTTNATVSATLTF